MPPAEASKDMLVQRSTEISDQDTYNSLDGPLDKMSPHTSVTGGVSAALETPFRLMDLPAELRNNIYRHYFSELSALKPKESALRPRNGAFWPETGAAFLSILQASHQVRREAAPIFYQEYIDNASDEDEEPWIFSSYSVLDMLKTLLAISKQLKEYGPDTRVMIDCAPDADADMSDIANAVRELAGVPAAKNDISECGDFSVGHWDVWESFKLCGPVGQFDWSSLLGVYKPCMEGSETVN